MKRIEKPLAHPWRALVILPLAIPLMLVRLVLSGAELLGAVADEIWLRIVNWVQGE